MKTDRSWSLGMRPVYEHYEPVLDSGNYYHFDDVLRHVRVAVKSGRREVLVFHAVRPAPAPAPEEDYFFTYRRMVDPDDNPLDLDLNPFKQLIADAELGRKVREAGLKLK